MAQRRMFSKDITENDSFLEMPLSSQALYFHLGMQADDDGFVSPQRILRMVGCNNDDLRILITKKFVLAFDDGIVVIKHWKINNYLRSDRYKTTTHADKKALLTVKNNNSYTWYTHGIPLVDAGKYSIGKVLGESNDSQGIKENKDMAWNRQPDDFEEGVVDLDGDGSVKAPKKAQTKKYPNAPAIRKIFQEVLGRNPLDWNRNVTVLQACENLYTERGVDKVRNALEFYKENKDKEFCPQILSPVDLDRKYAHLSSFKVKQP